MEVGTGAIRASVSLPEFDQNNLSAYLDNPLYPFVNRAFSAHNVGSTFKLAVSALALENDYPTGYTYECKGWINIGGQTFTCQNHALPKVMDMKTALETSCNTYFIFLSKVLSANRLLPYAKTLRFGETTVFANDYTAAAGTLPTLDDLKNPAELANFAFGQGKFTATPVQIAAMVGAVANNGYLPYPYIVEGFTQDGTQITEFISHPTQTAVMKKSSASRLKSYMVSVVENGSGENAYIEGVGAGGKTASAQTGKLDENGEEIVDAWFSGFFPKDKPKYVIVVLNEGMSSGGKYAAPVFREIANKITLLEQYR
jgi:penicillin-binding protein 2